MKKNVLDFEIGQLPVDSAVGRRKLSGRQKRDRIRVALRNAGTASARDMIVKAAGPGLSGSAPMGRLAPGKKCGVKITVELRRPGPSRQKFKLFVLR